MADFMTNYDVVKKLIGEIKPIGETNSDEDRFENLKEMIELVDDLIVDIQDVADKNVYRDEASMYRAGKYADDFLTGIVNMLNG